MRDAAYEVKKLCDKAGRMLHAQEVLDAARDRPGTALHAHFEWDDNVAGEAYRLQQARQLIQVVIYKPPGSGVTQRYLVNIRNDRQAGGGYRRRPDVLADETLRTLFLRDAVAEFHHLRLKYSDLEELQSIFDAVDLLWEVYGDEPKKSPPKPAKKGRKKPVPHQPESRA